MNERKNAGNTLPNAKIRKGRAAWLLWLVPLGAAALCVWFLYRDFIATGPLLTLYFRNAEGLEPKNTQVNFRGAQVGQVKGIALTKDGQFVKVSVRLVAEAKNLARAGSVFWIVRPELKLGAISGLRTIVSGEYIAVQPGTGAFTNTFVGAEMAPIPGEDKGLHLELLAPNLSSLQDLSPIFFRGIQVGEILSYQLGADSQDVTVRALIRQEYAPLVRLNSRFWNVGGIDFRFGLFRGAEISAESAKTLVSGGIEFATPPELQEAATNGTTFRLYEKAKDEWKTWTPSIHLRLPAQAPQTATPSNSLLK